MADLEAAEWDYVIVGSGAAGGTLAARLVEAGMRVDAAARRLASLLR